MRRGVSTAAYVGLVASGVSRGAAPVSAATALVPAPAAPAPLVPRRFLVAKPLPAWKCHRCRATNFADKPKCFACQAEHPKLKDAEYQVLGKGEVLEWRCPRCQARNNRTNLANRCFACKCPKPEHYW